MPLAAASRASRTTSDNYVHHGHLGDFLRVDFLAKAPSTLRAMTRLERLSCRLWRSNSTHGLNAFLGSTGLRPTTLGMQAVGDPSLLRQIERGRSPSLRTADRILGLHGRLRAGLGRREGSARPPGRAGAGDAGEEGEPEQSDE